MNTWNRRFIYVRYKHKEIIDLWKKLPILFKIFCYIYYIKLKYPSVSDMFQSDLHGMHLKYDIIYRLIILHIF